MRFLMTDSKTGWKVHSGTQSNGLARGRELVHKLRNKVKSEFEDFVTRKS